MLKTASIYKNLGETPLQALERFRAKMVKNGMADSAIKSAWQKAPMTYAGRLDPLAEGELLILIGDECKNKDKYLGKDKEYEIEIVFGVRTDSYDALGLATLGDTADSSSVANIKKLDLSKYCGKFMQEYPPYSSKTVGGKQLHSLSRADELPDEMPEKEVMIYSIEKISDGTIGSKDLLTPIMTMIDLVQGDFRQEQIKNRWAEVLSKIRHFSTLKCRIKCSSGTYMRSLANRIGNDLGTGAFAIHIKRTKIL